jgi:WD repeat-containing protein 61
MVRATTLHKVAAHDEGVWALAWVPGSTPSAPSGTHRILTGSVDETVRAWDVGAAGGDAQADPTATTTTGGGVSLAHTYSGQTLGVVSVAVDPTGEFAAASALDSTVRVWSLRDGGGGAMRAALEAPPTETWGVSFVGGGAGGSGGGDGSLMLAVAGGTTGKARVHRIGGGGEEGAAGGASVTQQYALPSSSSSSSSSAPTTTDPPAFVLAARASPNDNGSRLAASAMDGTVALFDTATGALLHTLKGHHRPVRSLCWTPDGKHLLTACDDAHAHLYDAHTGALVEAFSGHGSWVLDVAVEPVHGACFATASSDGRVRLFELGGGRGGGLVQTLQEHGDQVWGVAFVAGGGGGVAGGGGEGGGTLLASCGDDRQLVVYAVA